MYYDDMKYFASYPLYFKLDGGTVNSRGVASASVSDNNYWAHSRTRESKKVIVKLKIFLYPKSKLQFCFNLLAH